MKFWNNIMNGLRARKGEFTGTSGKGAELASTAIKSARYDPEDDSLNITYQGGDKEYKFRAGGPEGVKEWITADSKGRKTN